MQLSTVLPEGMVFPYDFGFVPSTVGEDGDPLDILILMEASVIPGCVVRARLVGAIKAEQKGKGENWIRNDRLIGIATHAQTHDSAQNLGDLRPHLLDEIKEFFVTYNKLRGHQFRAKTIIATARSAGERARAPSAIARATSGQTAVFRPKRLAGTPRAEVLLAFV
jgi:inorganic pyrophosphatase